MLIAWPVAAADPAPGECPQPRFTGKAPPEIYALTNPLPDTSETLNAGERLYLDKSAPVPCVACHGKNGDGKGTLATQFSPPPRNFTCTATVNGIPDGQLFWIIRNGSPGTAMPASRKLTDQQVWQLVYYLRHLAR